MATAQALLSGGVRISSTSNLITQAFSSVLNASAFIDLEFVVQANISDFVVSMAQFSYPNFVAIQSDQKIRVNFGGNPVTSYISNASAGYELTQFIWMGSGISGPASLRFSNSGSTSATIRVTMCTS